MTSLLLPLLLASPSSWPSVDGMVQLKGGIALAGALLLLWGYWLARRGKPAAHQRVRDVLLVVLGVLAAAGWWNAGRFHFPRYVHDWDAYHYVMGARYFPEVGYTRLYRCAAVADAEDGLGVVVKVRTMRNLETNELTTTEAALAAPEVCKAHFTETRWQEFRADSRYFRDSLGAKRWQRVQSDHGFNGTPAWLVAGSSLAQGGPITAARMLKLAWLDPLLIAAMFACVAWAFGWRVMCVALLWWGTNEPAQFKWTGGGYLRQDWLAALVIGICMLKRDRGLTAGFALATSALLRVFPVFALLAVGFGAAVRAYRRRALGATERRLALGVLLALLLFLPLSARTAGGGERFAWQVWSEFAHNSAKHLNTPLTNNVGLKTLVAFDFATRASVLKAPRAEDPHAVWKQARRATFKARWPLLLVAGALFALLLGRAVSRSTAWEAAVLGTGAIAVATDLSCYYFGFLLAFAFLWPRLPLVGVALLLVSAASCAIPSVWAWDDLRFAAFSVLAVLLVVSTTGYLAWQRPAADT